MSLPIEVVRHEVWVFPNEEDRRWGSDTNLKRLLPSFGKLMC